MGHLQAGHRSYVHQRRDVAAMLVLTAVSGVVDAVSFLGLGEVFLANMTGNVAILGFALLTEDPAQGLRAGASLVAFAVGAVLAGRLSSPLPSGAAWHRGLNRLLAVEVVLLVAAAVAVAAVGVAAETSGAERYGVIVTVSLAMGVQGALARRVGVADVPTTVVTSTLTGLAVDARVTGGPGTRSRRRALAVGSLLVGAVVGGVCVTYVSLHAGLVLASVLVAAVLVSGMHRVQQPDLTSPAEHYRVCDEDLEPGE